MNLQTVAFSVFILAFAVVLGSVFFLRARGQMEMQLKQSLKLTTLIATQQFDAEAIRSVKGRESMETPQFKEIIRRLRTLRRDVPNIRFAYILRRTDDATLLEFVADADSLATDEELDTNGDGTVDAEEQVASFPGDPYDPLLAPAMGEAFAAATTDDDLTIDQWGSTMSGYAPIKDAKGETVAILGIDMNAADYVTLTQRVFSPVAYLVFCITAILLVIYVGVFLWQRRMEALRRIDQERSGLMLVTFHQLGTPLTISKWSLETLMEAVKKGEPLEQAILEHAKNMGVAMSHITSILESMKKAALVEGGHIVYLTESVIFRDFCEGVLAEFQGTLQRRGVHVELDMSPALRVPLDRVHVGGVLRELLQNAIDYSPDGSMVTLSARRQADHVSVQVVDHGCGITKEDSPRLFGKYMRGKDAARFRPDGNGMGLYVARGIIKRAGGDIWVDSTEKVGTKVTFTLPVPKDGKR